MKKCPYCGKEYPDDVILCAIDGELLSDDSPQLAVAAEPAGETTPRKEEPYLTFPDYQWSANDAWKCLGTIFLIGFLLFAVNRLIYSFLPAFWISGYGYFFDSVLHYGTELLIAAYFARTETFATFWKGFGLDRKPTNYVWFGMVMALVIRAIGHFMIVHGWGKGVYNYDLSAYRHTIGYKKYFFLIPMLIFAPLFEESIYRGFVYKAFRGSYPISVCMVLIVVWTANTHWRFYSHSWTAAFDLSLLTIVQCYLREKSDSVWDCILCHFAYNASLLFI